jgi:hypothetical protein
MARKPLYYVLNMILPVVLLSILNIFVFVLPAASGEKSGYAMTVFLAFAVFLTIISTNLPENSEVSFLSAYMALQVVQSTIITLLTMLQLRLFHRSEKQAVPRLGLGLVRLSAIVCCKTTCRVGVVAPRPEEDKVEDFNPATDDTSVGWDDVVDAMDSILFLVFLLFTAVSTGGMLGAAHHNL